MYIELDVEKGVHVFPEGRPSSDGERVGVSTDYGVQQKLKGVEIRQQMIWPG